MPITSPVSPKYSNPRRTRRPEKRLFITPKRVYHNGIVKRPSKDEAGHERSDVELLGPTKEIDGETIITGLADNLLTVPDDDMNRSSELESGAQHLE